jgi:hypothetical protein
LTDILHWRTIILVVLIATVALIAILSAARERQ